MNGAQVSRSELFPAPPTRGSPLAAPTLTTRTADAASCSSLPTASGKRFGWFGKPLTKNASRAWNLLPDPTPTATPYQLSKEYVYAGQKLLTVEDKNATAVPPADLGIWRPGTQGVWYVRITGSTWTTQNWGVTGDIPVVGDFDADGTTDFSVWRPSNNTWYVVYSSTSTSGNYAFGASGDLVAPADYDGDGKTDEAVFRPSNNTWYIHASTAGYYTFAFGNTGDKPAPADYS